jgi:hypothetical protein
VGERDLDGHPERSGPLARAAAQAHTGRLVTAAGHLDLARRPGLERQRLGDRLLRAEPGGEVHRGAGTRLRVRTLAGREQAVLQIGPARQSALQPVDLEEVDADHSTVTVLARLRGWSTLRPAPAGDAVGQELQRDDGEQGLEHPVGLRHADDLLGVLADRDVALRGDAMTCAPRARTSCMFDTSFSSTGESVATATTACSGRAGRSAVLHLPAA